MSERIIPKKYQKLYDKRNKSRKSAIRSQCLECMYYESNEIKDCTDLGCPLHHWREKG